MGSLCDNRFIFGQVTQIAFVLLIASAVATTLRDAVKSPIHRYRFKRVIKGLRLWMFPQALACLLLSIVAYSALISLFPILTFGWWSLLGGTGNPALGHTNIPGIAGVAIAVVMTCTVAVAMPEFALQEEKLFRVRAEQRTKKENALSALKFGLIHVLIGIPVGFAFTLSIAGLWLTRIYLRHYRKTELPLAGTFAPNGDLSKPVTLHLDNKTGQTYLGTLPVNFLKVIPEALNLKQVVIRPEDFAEAAPFFQEQVFKQVGEESLFAAASAHLAYNWLAVGIIATFVAIHIF